MSTNDVPGANPANNDELRALCWAEHDDGSLIVVESVEVGTVIYSIFDVAQTPPVEYRDAMPEDGFKKQFSWRGPATRAKSPASGGTSVDKWTWHDKTPFPWDRVMRDFPAGQKSVSVDDTLNAAQRVARSLDLRAEGVRARQIDAPTMQKAATLIMQGIQEALQALDVRR